MILYWSLLLKFWAHCLILYRVLETTRRDWTNKFLNVERSCCGEGGGGGLVLNCWFLFLNTAKSRTRMMHNTEHHSCMMMLSRSSSSIHIKRGIMPICLTSLYHLNKSTVNHLHRHYLILLKIRNMKIINVIQWMW